MLQLNYCGVGTRESNVVRQMHLDYYAKFRSVLRGKMMPIDDGRYDANVVSVGCQFVICMHGKDSDLTVAISLKWVSSSLYIEYYRGLCF